MSFHTLKPHYISMMTAALWLCAQAILAQPSSTATLSLASAQAQALQKNPQLLSQLAAASGADAQRVQSLGAFLPRVSVSEMGVITNSPLNAFGFLLQQQRVTALDFNPATLNSPGRVQNFLTQAEVQLPLVNVNAWQYHRAARSGAEAASLKTEYAAQNIIFLVEQVYFGTQLMAQSRRLLEQAYRTTQAALSYVQDQVEAGYALRADELAVRVRLSQIESEMLRMADQEASYQDQLNGLLGAARGSRWQLSDSLDFTPRPILPDSGFTLDQRADLRSYSLALDARTMALRAARLAVIPTLNAFGQFGLYDKNPFGSAGNNYLVGLQLKWDLFTGFERRAKVMQADADRRQLKADADAYAYSADAEWLQAWRQQKLQLQEVGQAEIAVEQAREAYRIRADRFSQGLEKALDLLAAETTRSEQELRLTQARYQLYLAHAKLRLLSTPATFSTITTR